MAMVKEYAASHREYRQKRWFRASWLIWTSVPAIIGLTIAAHMVWAWLQPLDWAKIGVVYRGGWVPMFADDFISSPLNPFNGLDDRTAGYIDLIWTLAVPATVVPATATAVWRRSRLAAGFYCVWLALITLYALWAMVGIMAPAAFTFCFEICAPSPVAARQTSAGLWLTLVALAWLWGTAFGRLATVRAEGSSTRWITLAGLKRSLMSPVKVSAVVFLAGILVWYFGYLFTPYATRGCVGFPVNWAHFTIGSCSGFDANNSIAAKTLAEGGSQQLYDFDLLLVGLATLAALIAIWQRGWLPIAISALLASLTTPLTVAAVAGVPYLLATNPAWNPAHVNAPWVVGAGPAVTIAGAIILWLGVAALVATRVWASRAARR